MENILLSLTQFIEKQEKEYPTTATKAEMQKLVFEKYKAICDYNKFLQQSLQIEMFDGETKIFKGLRYVDLQPSTQWNYHEIACVRIFQEGNGIKYMSLGKTIADIAGRGVRLTDLK